MLTEQQKNLLWLSLHEAIEAWLNDLSDAGSIKFLDALGEETRLKITMPYLGENTSGSMADAALAVFVAIEEAQSSAISVGYLNHSA